MVSAVDRVEAGAVQSFGVAEVVQPGGGEQERPVGFGDRGRAVMARAATPWVCCQRSPMPASRSSANRRASSTSEGFGRRSGTSPR
jgi:hypothetical protein